MKSCTYPSEGTHRRDRPAISLALSAFINAAVMHRFAVLMITIVYASVVVSMQDIASKELKQPNLIERLYNATVFPRNLWLMICG